MSTTITKKALARPRCHRPRRNLSPALDEAETLFPPSAELGDQLAHLEEARSRSTASRRKNWPALARVCRTVIDQNESHENTRKKEKHERSAAGLSLGSASVFFRVFLLSCFRDWLLDGKKAAGLVLKLFAIELAMSAAGIFAEATPLQFQFEPPWAKKTSRRPATVSSRPILSQLAVTDPKKILAILCEQDLPGPGPRAKGAQEKWAKRCARAKGGRQGGQPERRPRACRLLSVPRDAGKYKDDEHGPGWRRIFAGEPAGKPGFRS